MLCNSIIHLLLQNLICLNINYMRKYTKIKFFSVYTFIGFFTFFDLNLFAQNDSINAYKKITNDKVYVTENTKNVYAGFLQLNAGEKLDWPQFKKILVGSGFPWNDLVAFQEYDNRILFLVKNNDYKFEVKRGLYGFGDTSHVLTSPTLFLRGVMIYSRYNQTCSFSEFKPLTLQHPESAMKISPVDKK